MRLCTRIVPVNKKKKWTFLLIYNLKAQASENVSKSTRAVN